MDEPQSEYADGASDDPLVVVTLEEFHAVQCEAPIAGDRSVLSKYLGGLYQKAAQEAETSGEDRTSRVYGMLGTIAQMHHRAHDPGEPYGPMMVADGKRSLIPDDLRGRQTDVLRAIAPNIRNAGLRARIADIVWLNDRRHAEMAQLAISSIILAVRLAADGDADLSYAEERSSRRHMVGLSRRACQIATATNWKEPEGPTLRELIKELAQEAFEGQDAIGFLKFGELARDYDILEDGTIAPQAEMIAAMKGIYPDTARELWYLAARSFKNDGKKTKSECCLVSAAECYVAMAEGAGMKGMAAASWLTDAIRALRGVPGTRERRLVLKTKLLETQATILEEMHPVSVEIDISKLVDHGRKVVAGRTLVQAIAQFVQLDASPNPDQLRKEAIEQANNNPISSIAPMVVYDDDGKVVANSPGLSGGDDDDKSALRQLIIQHEGRRRHECALGFIEPARRLLNAEHPLGTQDFVPLVQMSPFVPNCYEDLFAIGFARFFTGDFACAVHILVPQLENSLRYVLKQAGIDPSAIRNDMTQENRTLSVMLDKDRETLEKIFGAAIIFDIENLFDVRGGPSLRHQLSHGLLGIGGSCSPDVIYACWFIFKLSCLPLFPHWEDVSKVYAEL